jgi:ATP-dependent Lon protease
VRYLYKSESYSIPQRLIFIPLKETVIFPYVLAPLFFQSDEALSLLNKMMLENSLIGCVSQRDPHLKDPKPKDLLSVGTVCKVLQLVKLPNKGIKIFVEGLSRVFLQNITQETHYFKADVKEVMKESAQAALSYIRANTQSLQVPENFYQEWDIHIHIPAGATPKDGPSADITIATAVLSLLKEKPVPHEIAMTGELTLSGRVLPVGGIKEKILAARRAGVKTVILPKKNEENLNHIPDYVTREMNLVLVEHIQEVLNLTLPS